MVMSCYNNEYWRGEKRVHERYTFNRDQYPCGERHYLGRTPGRRGFGEKIPLLLPAYSKMILMFWKHCRVCSSNLSLTTFPESRSKPGVPDTKINFSAITACGKA